MCLKQPFDILFPKILWLHKLIFSSIHIQYHQFHHEYHLANPPNQPNEIDDLHLYFSDCDQNRIKITSSGTHQITWQPNLQVQCIMHQCIKSRFTQKLLENPNTRIQTELRNSECILPYLICFIWSQVLQVVKQWEW